MIGLGLGGTTGVWVVRFGQPAIQAIAAAFEIRPAGLEIEPVVEESVGHAGYPRKTCLGNPRVNAGFLEHRMNECQTRPWRLIYSLGT
jgi:hypothetical protein